MRQFLYALTLLLLGSGCAALQPPAPTPIIIVVTATPESNGSVSAPTASATRTRVLSDTPIPVTVTPNAASTFPTKATDVKYVRAKQDINIRKGPGVQYDIVGGVYTGQTVQVTGVTNADATWWRVLCPDGSMGDCWVSADTTLTETVDAPNAEPTPTVSTAMNLKNSRFPF